MPHFLNAALKSLPISDFQLLRPNLKTIQLRIGDTISSPDIPVTHAIFPHSGILSIFVSFEDGENIEVAMVGRNSVFGASAALDGGVTVKATIVQLAGRASTIDIHHLQTAAEKSVSIRTMLMRHEEALFLQAAQSAGCNAIHTVKARLARWLLHARDLTTTDQLDFTQERLSQMLGSRRGSVSLVANTLKHSGFIDYSRGIIGIKNVEGLRATSCECYESVRRCYESISVTKSVH